MKSISERLAEARQQLRDEGVIINSKEWLDEVRDGGEFLGSESAVFDLALRVSEGESCDSHDSRVIARAVITKHKQLQRMCNALPRLLAIAEAAGEYIDNLRDMRAPDIGTPRLEAAVDAARKERT